MSMFFDMVVVAFLSPISNYCNYKKCEILGKYSDDYREEYAEHWVEQTKLYGGFVRRYLELNNEEEE